MDENQIDLDRSRDTEHGGGRWAFLAGASRLLADSLDYETTLATIAAMALPHLGAWCFVDLCGPGGEMRRVAVVHPDPRMQSLARRLESGWPPHREDPFGVPRAVRTRRSEVLAEVPDEMLVEVSRSGMNLQILRELGIGSMMVVPLLARGEVLGAITFVSPQQGQRYGNADLELAEDLAARCAIAIDNARLYREALQSRSDAEAASRAKSEFLAIMSHETRTPLNAIIGYADLLDAGVGGGLNADQARFLERIRASSQHLLGLIDDVLDLARSDAGRLQVHSEVAVAASVADAAMDLVRPQAEARSLTISTLCEGERGVRFVGDVDRVRQILLNLLSNAVKFTSEGGRVRVSCGRADEAGSAVAVSGTGPWTWLRVEDNGIGMEPELQDRVFEPFVQGETGHTRSREGSGLGLAISRRLARAMGGDLLVESRPGEGSAFTLWLLGADSTGEPGKSSPAGTPAVGLNLRAAGLSTIGAHLRANADRISGTYAANLCERLMDGFVVGTTDAMIQDHAVSLLADMGQSLVLLEESVEEAADLMRDGSAIQRTIADRHGLQRQRIGWTEAALEEDFDLLWEEVQRAARAAPTPHPGASLERAMELLAGFLDQARRGSLRSFRMAARAARNAADENA